MKKVMKVKLDEYRKPTPEQGKLYMTQDWEIPFESLDNLGDKTPIEVHMLQELKGKFPEEHQGSIQYMLYGDLSRGGSLKHGDVTLTVSFGEASITY